MVGLRSDLSLRRFDHLRSDLSLRRFDQPGWMDRRLAAALR
jgi:hypothetical protein